MEVQEAIQRLFYANVVAFELSQNFLCWFFKKEKNLLRESGLVFGEKVLDLGCGTGYISNMIKSEFYLGVDKNPNFVEYANKKYNGIFLVGDIIKLNYKSKFDKIFLSQILHHLEDDSINKVISIINDLISEKGKIIIFEVVWPENRCNLKRKILSFDKGRNIKTMEELKKMLSENFDILISKRYQVGPFNLPFFDFAFIVLEGRND